MADQCWQQERGGSDIYGDRVGDASITAANYDEVMMT